MVRPARQKARCPECLAPIWLRDDLALHHPITCHECHSALWVAQLRPLTLGYMPLDPEDAGEEAGSEDGDENSEPGE